MQFNAICTHNETSPPPKQSSFYSILFFDKFQFFNSIRYKKTCWNSWISPWNGNFSFCSVLHNITSATFLFLPVTQVCLHYHWESIPHLWGEKATSAEPLLPLSIMVWREQPEPWYYFFIQECNCTNIMAPGHVTAWSIRLLYCSLFYLEVMAEGWLRLNYNMCLGHCKKILWCCSFSVL